MRIIPIFLLLASPLFALAQSPSKALPPNFQPVNHLKDCMAKDENDLARVLLLDQLRSCVADFGKDYGVRHCGQVGGQLLEESKLTAQNKKFGSTLSAFGIARQAFTPLTYAKRVGMPAVKDVSITPVTINQLIDENKVTKAFVALDEGPISTGKRFYSTIYEVDLKTGKIISAEVRNLKVGSTLREVPTPENVRQPQYPVKPPASLTPAQLQEVKTVIAAGLTERVSDPNFQGHAWKQETTAFNQELSKDLTRAVNPSTKIISGKVFLPAAQMNLFRSHFMGVRGMLSAVGTRIKPGVGMLGSMALGPAIELLLSGPDPGAKAITSHRDFLDSAHPDNLLNECSTIKAALDEFTNIEVADISCPKDRTKDSPIQFNLTRKDGGRLVTEKVAVEPQYYTSTVFRDVAKVFDPNVGHAYSAQRGEWKDLTHDFSSNRKIAISLVADLISDRCHAEAKPAGFKIDLSNVGQGKPPAATASPAGAN